MDNLSFEYVLTPRKVLPIAKFAVFFGYQNICYWGFAIAGAFMFISMAIGITHPDKYAMYNHNKDNTLISAFIVIPTIVAVVGIFGIINRLRRSFILLNVLMYGEPLKVKLAEMHEGYITHNHIVINNKSRKVDDDHKELQQIYDFTYKDNNGEDQCWSCSIDYKKDDTGLSLGDEKEALLDSNNNFTIPELELDGFVCNSLGEVTVIKRDAVTRTAIVISLIAFVAAATLLKLCIA